MHPPLSTLDDDAWDDLLNFIEERRVIPILGPELLTVETETGPGCSTTGSPKNSPPSFPSIPRSSRSPIRSMTSSAGSCRRGGDAKRRTRAAQHPARREFRTAAGAAPARTDHRLQPLRHHHFDPLLEQAINAERFGGAQSTEVIAYAPIAWPTWGQSVNTSNAQSSITCSGDFPRPRPMSFPTRTRWSSSARCKAST